MGAFVPPTALEAPAPVTGDGVAAVERVEQKLEERLADLSQEIMQLRDAGKGPESTSSARSERKARAKSRARGRSSESRDVTGSRPRKPALRAKSVTLRIPGQVPSEVCLASAGGEPPRPPAGSETPKSAEPKVKAKAKSKARAKSSPRAMGGTSGAMGSGRGAPPPATATPQASSEEKPNSADHPPSQTF